MNILLGMKVLCMVFGGSSHHNWAIFKGHFYAF